MRPGSRPGPKEPLLPFLPEAPVTTESTGGKQLPGPAGGGPPVNRPLRASVVRTQTN